MEFYNIKDDYIRFLSSYDGKVAFNKQSHRPYVGVVLEVGNVKYYAPFSSPKPKHLKMKNSKDFRKIHNGEYGAINFNNMIPVPDRALILIDIQSIPDRQYKRLLENQYHDIQKDAAAIFKTAERLRTLVFAPDTKLSEFDRNIKSRCCNLPLLESIYQQYNK